MLMDGDRTLVEKLVEHFPELREIYEIHVENNGGLLAHVFFWDVTQEILQCYLGGPGELQDWRPVLDFLEEEYGKNDALAREVIVTSFIDNLPYSGQPGEDLSRHLGPRLAEVHRRLRHNSHGSGLSGQLR
ncbi:hypothetical protein GCM10010439_18410 [Actinocorallia aurantiaca]|uniref:DUF7674 domain-containing protein n=2 Tax=Actinocorallia aurantiaca TaxID=46204 RepID=A0ABP6GKR8_9ACTN